MADDLVSVEVENDYFIDGSDFSILSVFNDKLLVRTSDKHRLLVYNNVGSYQTIIGMTYSIIDAKWTPDNNVVCIQQRSKYSLVLLKLSGQEITHTDMIYTLAINDCIDGFYVVDWPNYQNQGVGFANVYRSTDNGYSWSLMFKLSGKSKFGLFVKVFSDHSDDYWTTRYDNFYEKSFLCIYSVNRTLPFSNATAKDVLDSRYGSKSHFEGGIMNWLLFDGKKTVIVGSHMNGNNSIHSFLPNGTYHIKLYSSTLILPNNRGSTQFSITLDKKRYILYAVSWSLTSSKAKMDVFKLKYAENGER